MIVEELVGKITFIWDFKLQGFDKLSETIFYEFTMSKQLQMLHKLKLFFILYLYVKSIEHANT